MIASLPIIILEGRQKELTISNKINNGKNKWDPLYVTASKAYL